MKCTRGQDWQISLCECTPPATLPTRRPSAQHTGASVPGQRFLSKFRLRKVFPISYSRTSPHLEQTANERCDTQAENTSMNAPALPSIGGNRLGKIANFALPVAVAALAASGPARTAPPHLRACRPAPWALHFWLRFQSEALGVSLLSDTLREYPQNTPTPNLAASGSKRTQADANRAYVR